MADFSNSEYRNIQAKIRQLYTRGIGLFADVELLLEDQLNEQIQELTTEIITMVRNELSSRVVYLRSNTRPPEVFVPPEIPRPRHRPPRYSDAHTRQPGRRGRRPIVIEDIAEEDIIPVEVPIEQRVKIKTISSELFAKECVDICAICMETHSIGNSIKTDCNHEFGKQCFQSWMKSANSNHKCPTCRKEKPQMMMYRKK